MNRKGVTVIELVIALAVGATVAIVTAALFKAGLKTFQYTARQNAALYSATTAFDGDGNNHGMVWMTHAAQSVSALTSTKLIVVSAASVPTVFSISGGKLYKVSISTHIQATDVSSMTITYYNMDTSGLIAESTVASSATFATFLLQVSGLTGTQKTYNFFTGAQLRNHN